MQCSVIIPAFNAGKTIGKCLTAIFNSDFKEFEVIVVDDASKDNTVAVAGEFGCKINSLNKNSGSSYCRNTGAEAAHGDILVFIDADVVINKTTLGKIVETLSSKTDIVGIVSIFSKPYPNSNFFSQYKGLYMHYIFNKCPSYIDFIHSSCFGIRRKYFEPYDVTYKIGEDTELGMRLSSKGYKILLDKDLEVIHLKKYSFGAFIKNDFKVPYAWTRLLIERKVLNRLARKRRFFHARGTQLLSIAASFLLLGAIFLSPILAVLFGVFFIALNSHFLLFLYNEKGPLFAIKAVFVTWIDALVMGAGVMAGVVSNTPVAKRFKK